MVGMTGFEPATPWSQTRCTTKLCDIPIATLRAMLEHYSILIFAVQHFFGELSDFINEFH